MSKVSNIAAIATGLSPAGISIIRVSGESAISEVSKIFKGPNLKEVNPNTLTYGHIHDHDTIIDEVLVGIMHNPRSFTGEDIVEINCHGGLLITQRILQLILTLDVELAEPGEFSKRAFLNGKKSLSEVAQTLELIEAKNETALNLAINTFSKPTNKLIEDLRIKLLDIISVIEVSIDYPEYDDIVEITNQELLPQVIDFKQEINEIIVDSKRGALFKNGIDVAIIGSPNVGKSSLLNYMSRETKAIVTDIAGTTRDVVSSEINMKGLSLNLLDTAGIRKTDDTVEKIGVEISHQQIDKAELILFVIDSSRELNHDEIELYKKIKTKKHIVILNKTDLETKVDISLFDQYVSLSALKQSGIESLETKIMEVLDLINFDSQNAKYINRISDVNKLEKVKLLLDSVEEGIEIGLPIDTLEIDLKDALFELGEILGIEVKNDLLNELFSRFCLGK